MKRSKDLDQASALFDALAERRSSDLAASWSGAYERGPRWRKPLKDALVDLDPTGRDRLLFALGATRRIVPNLDIEFRDAPPRYDFSREVVLFSGRTCRGEEDCAISRAAPDDWYDADAKGQDGRLDAFRKHRAEIEAMARDIYLNEPVPADGSVLIRTLDVPRLRARLKSRARRR